MTEKGEKKQDDLSFLDEELTDWEKDFLGLNEEQKFIDFKCVDCGCIDPVPEFIVGEFSWDLEDGEEVEMHCPECNGTMRRKKEEAED
jgi:hypothetical protein